MSAAPMRGDALDLLGELRAARVDRRPGRRRRRRPCAAARSASRPAPAASRRPAPAAIAGTAAGGAAPGRCAGPVSTAGGASGLPRSSSDIGPSSRRSCCPSCQSPSVRSPHRPSRTTRSTTSSIASRCGCGSAGQRALHDEDREAVDGRPGGDLGALPALRRHQPGGDHLVEGRGRELRVRVRHVAVRRDVAQRERAGGAEQPRLTRPRTARSRGRWPPAGRRPPPAPGPAVSPPTRAAITAPKAAIARADTSCSRASRSAKCR